MAKKKLKLDLACGQSCTPGYLGVDVWEGADVVHNLLEFPWPFDDRSVADVVCSHFVEHIPLADTADGQDLLCAFMDELWRVVAPGGTATITYPHLQSVRAFQDPTHRRFIPWTTWNYFDAQWRKANRLDHYRIGCDFEPVSLTGEGIANDVAARADEPRMLMMERSWNVVADTRVILRRR